jgi:hypothetical protein
MQKNLIMHVAAMSQHIAKQRLPWWHEVIYEALFDVKRF